MYGNVDWFFLCHVSNDCNYDLKSFLTDHTVHYDVVSQKNKHNFVRKKEGGFALENSADDVYVLQNGIYRFNGKWKKRGIGNLGNKQIEHLDTIEKDGNLYQIMKVLRVNRLRTAILSDSIHDIGKFSTVKRLVNLNADRKRLWFEDLTNVNDREMIDSMPISLNYLFS